MEPLPDNTGNRSDNLKRKALGKLTISERISPDHSYAFVEDGAVKAVLNESTRRKGYMPMEKAKAFAWSLINAMIERDKNR